MNEEIKMDPAEQAAVPAPLPEDRPPKRRAVRKLALSAEQAEQTEQTEGENTLQEPSVDLVDQNEELDKEVEEAAEETASSGEAVDNSHGDFEAKEAPAQEVSEGEKKKQEEPLSDAAGVFDWVKSFLLSLTAVIFIFTLLFRGVTVSGGSMLPTLSNNEYLIISDLFYTPKTGDIVVVQSPHYKNGTEPLIKRVIATGGQTLKIDFNSWQIWVDGEELEEDYVFYEPGLSMQKEDMACDENGIAEIVVEDNCIFVMGDHRNDSLDSRSSAVGQIDCRFIMGRVLFRVTPASKFGKVE